MDHDRQNGSFSTVPVGLPKALSQPGLKTITLIAGWSVARPGQQERATLWVLRLWPTVFCVPADDKYKAGNILYDHTYLLL